MSRMGVAFNDRASLILREMLTDPDRKWVVRDFVSTLKVGQGWVSEVWSSLRAKSHLKGEVRGRAAGASLRAPDQLVQEWTHHYSFNLNKDRVFYSADPDILIRLKEFVNKKRLENNYALTLHSGANLLTQYVNDPSLYVYLHPDNYETLLFDLRLALDLKELKQGGNIHLIRPYYKHSVFHRMRKIKGTNVVSNLQLYLDLYNFPARGREHADYLLRMLKKEGKHLD